MKKIFSIILMLILSFTIIGCGKTELPKGIKDRDLYVEGKAVYELVYRKFKDGTEVTKKERDKVKKYVTKHEIYNLDKYTEDEKIMIGGVVSAGESFLEYIDAKELDKDDNIKISKEQGITVCQNLRTFFE